MAVRNAKRGRAQTMPKALAVLAKKTKSNPGAPFAPDALKALAELRKTDQAAFENFRSELKAAGCRVMELDEAIAKETGDAARPRPTQADRLVEHAGAATFFRTADGTVFADVVTDKFRASWPIRSRDFARWLTRRFHEATRGAPGSEALQAALGVIEAKATHHGASERQVHVRVGGRHDRIFIDLGDATWRAVEIDATGWRVVNCPPVRFRRAPGMTALPVPVRGGSIEDLRALLNVRSDADFVLIIACLVAALRGRGPYPVIVLVGEQGSAKTTVARIIRALVDPNIAPVRALPRDERDLTIAANNGHVLAFDNVSNLPAWLSDAFCRLATGGGFATRQLFSDADEALFDAVRPIVLNGIDDFVTRPDLADRAIFVTLEPIPEERRRPEAEIWAAFEAARPRIFGVLLDAVAEGLRQLPETRLARLPRMADFALWFSACETAFWPAGTFMAAYAGNRDDAIGTVVQADAVAAAVVGLMEAMQTAWKGTASELLRALALVTEERVVASKSWPESPQALSGRLRRAATFLRKVGIAVTFEREGRERTRVVRIARAGADAADDGSGATVRANTLKYSKKTDADAADANLHTEGGEKLYGKGVLPPEAERGGKLASASSAPSAAEPKSCPANDLAGHSMRTHHDGADDGTVRGEGVPENVDMDGRRAVVTRHGRYPGR